MPSSGVGCESGIGSGGKTPQAWLFNQASLDQIWRTANERATQALLSAGSDVVSSSNAEVKTGKSKQSLRPLDIHEERRFIQYCAEKLPQLCELCKAPCDVLWTAVVFFRRFFTMSSAMEVDPVTMLFACVHLACKVEEVHEITLQRLLHAADCDDAGMRGKVADLELPLMEGIGFQLLVEPKPDSAFKMLAEEIRELMTATSDDLEMDEISRVAERLIVDFCIRTDAALLWPVPIIIGVAFRAALDVHTNITVKDELRLALDAVMYSGVDAEAQRDSIQLMMADAACAISKMKDDDNERNNASTCDLEELKKARDKAFNQVKKRASRCHKVFDELRMQATDRNDAQRLERKRKSTEVKSQRSKIPVSVAQSLNELSG